MRSQTVRQNTVLLDYTNHRGERATRIVLPVDLRFGTSPYHDGAQWFLEAYDVAKGADRSFAMRDIHSWKPER